jgi:hypothetical protein
VRAGQQQTAAAMSHAALLGIMVVALITIIVAAVT